MVSYLLPSLILLPLVGSVILFFVPSSSVKTIRVGGLLISSATFMLSLLAWVFFDPSSTKFQFVYEAPWLGTSNIYLILWIDGISLFFVVLSAFLIPLCLLAGWESIERQKEYVIAFLVLEALMIAVFCLLDLFLFYVFFESVLIPMFFIIGIFGSRERKIRAAYQFFLYTLSLIHI